MTAILIKE